MYLLPVHDDFTRRRRAPVPSADLASAVGAPVLQPDYDSKYHRLEVPQVLVVAIGLLIGPDRGITFCAVVEPSNRLGTE